MSKRELSRLEWGSVVVAIAGFLYALAGPALVRAPRGPEVGSLLALEGGGDTAPVARFDDSGFKLAAEEAGLPEPPELDGGDPVPVGKIVNEVDRWVREGDPEALGNLGRLYLALDEHRPALECFAAAAALEPERFDWPYFVGIEAQALGLDELAIGVLESASRMDPSYPTTWARLGELYLDQGDLGAAEESFERCRETAPGQSLGYVGLGRVALARDDPEKAAELLVRATQVTPNDFRAFRFLSRALAALGRGEESRRASEVAERLPRYTGWIAMDERLRSTHAFAGTQRHLENQIRIGQASGDAAHMAASAAELLERRPDDFQVWGLLAGALIQLERIDEARSAAGRALEIEPESVPMLCLGAEVEMVAGNLGLALVFVDRALAIDPKFATTHDIRGRVLYMAGSQAEGIAEVRHAIELDPASVKTRLALALMHEQRGEVDEARRELRELLEAEPGQVQALAELRRLGG